MVCSAGDLACQNGEIFVTADPSRRKTYRDVICYAADQYGGSGAIFVSNTYQPSSNPGPAAAHFAEVEVDIPMCKVKLLNILNVHDRGKLINPALAEGPVHGGMPMAVS